MPIAPMDWAGLANKVCQPHNFRSHELQQAQDLMEVHYVGWSSAAALPHELALLSGLVFVVTAKV